MYWRRDLEISPRMLPEVLILLLMDYVLEENEQKREANR